MRLRLNVVRFQYVLMLLVGLVMADGLITEFLINGKIAIEGNPFLRGFIASGDLMPVKIAGALFSVLLLMSIRRRNPKTAETVSLLFIIFYTVIVYWNVSLVGI